MKVLTSIFGKRSYQLFIRFLAVFFVMAALFASTSTAYAYTTWQGGDLGGQDLVLGDGDYLFGTFTNIGRLVIDSGITVYAGSSLVSLNAYETLINGTFFGGADLSPSLEVVAETAITIGGILDRWQSVSLTGGSSISLLAGASITNTDGILFGSETIYDSGLIVSSGVLTAGGDIDSPESEVLLVGGSIELDPDGLGQIVDGGGIITLAPVPIPSTLFLFSSGLVIVAALCRSRAS